MPVMSHISILYRKNQCSITLVGGWVGGVEWVSVLVGVCKWWVLDMLEGGTKGGSRVV